MIEIIWNPEAVPDDALVFYIHQHSVSPLTKTLGYFGQTPGARFIASDSNLPIKIAFKEAIKHAKREGLKKLVIIDPVGFGWLELRNVVQNNREHRDASNRLQPAPEITPLISYHQVEPS